MAIHGWPFSDPSTTARLFEAGPGPETTLANAAAWAVEAAVHDLSMGLSAINIMSMVPSFLGVGGSSAVETGSVLNALAGVMGGHCLKQQLIALAAVELYAAARAGLIPSELIDGNRMECAHDVGINPLVLGALTGRIAELNGEYGMYWAQNAAVGSAYGTGLNTLTTSLLSTPPPAAMGANPAGPAMMAASVTQNTVTDTATATARATGEYATQGAGSAGGGMEQVIGSVTQALGSAVSPIAGMFQSVPQMFQGMTSLPQSVMGAFGGMFGGMGANDATMVARVPATDALRALPGSGAGAGAGMGGGGGGSVGAGAPGLHSFTRPASSFEPEGGRATGLKQGLLNPAEVRTGPVASGMGGAGMPMSPAGMLHRGQGGDDRKDVQYARVVVGGDSREER